ncbi:alpha/beta hydrolase-fold protein [Massilia sp. MB5]|uniref:alpha/beta hydrolase n=1 Tax=Massilia sp. MB5 TaxID=2919578 RepID=UPI001F116899|nr:alpha/beta hydrolase-fold protein [Massilia sp. MB5]UMR32772.1 alpha/beta hydrolase-fold protein [Massilia sp. MB5]
MKAAQAKKAPARRRWLGGAAALVAAGLAPALASAAADAADAADKAGAGNASGATADGTWVQAALPQARQTDLRSRHTGQHYRIFISIPETPAPAAGHPVIYALDGNASFPSLALMARTVARRSKVTGRNAPVVVGIGYASGEDYDGVARSRDYTPPSAKASDKEGGADRFLDFIEQELKPRIAALAKIDPQRQALFGHSYGGLFTLHALFTRPAAFQTFIAASPSIWWGERFILSEQAGLAARAGAATRKPQLLLTVGELEQAVAPGKQLSERSAMLMEKRMVDAARDLAADLQKQSASDAGKAALARVRFLALAGEDHGSALFPALSRGLEFFLE